MLPFPVRSLDILQVYCTAYNKIPLFEERNINAQQKGVLKIW
jgi:hypothetical protein